MNRTAEVLKDGALRYNAGVEFGETLNAIARAFRGARVRFGVTGGFAVGLLGYPRATMDLDLLVHRRDLPTVHRLLTGLGYRRQRRTANVSRYRGRRAERGVVDLLHAFRPHTLAMLRRVRRLTSPLFEAAIPVLQPEDVIGLKVQAIANDPGRRLRDSVDIEALARTNRRTLRWSRVLEYYRIFDMERDGRDLKRRVGA